jgi:hypothetical protein
MKGSGFEKVANLRGGFIQAKLNDFPISRHLEPCAPVQKSPIVFDPSI